MSDEWHPKYWHDALGARPWSTIPPEIPEELKNRHMVRGGIRKRVLEAQSVIYYIRMPADGQFPGRVHQDRLH